MKTEVCDIRALPKDSAKKQLINSLEKMDGVKSVSVDRTQGIVKVKYDDNTSAQDIRNCIAGAGNKLE